MPWRASEAARRRFAAVMADALARQLDSGAGFLDSYAGTGPAEFFAVATEAFIECPARLAEQAPQVYEELARLYRIDPLRW